MIKYSEVLGKWLSSVCYFLKYNFTVRYNMFWNNFLLFLAVPGLPLLRWLFSSCGEQASRSGGFSCWRTGSRARASVVGVPGLQLTCSAARGLFPDQGSNLSLLHWQPDSSPLSHQESPRYNIFNDCSVTTWSFNSWPANPCLFPCAVNPIP